MRALASVSREIRWEVVFAAADTLVRASSGTGGECSPEGGLSTARSAITILCFRKSCSPLPCVRFLIRDSHVMSSKGCHRRKVSSKKGVIADCATSNMRSRHGDTRMLRRLSFETDGYDYELILLTTARANLLVVEQFPGFCRAVVARPDKFWRSSQ